MGPAPHRATPRRGPKAWMGLCVWPQPSLCSIVVFRLGPNSQLSGRAPGCHHRRRQPPPPPPPPPPLPPLLPLLLPLLPPPLRRRRPSVTVSRDRRPPPPPAPTPSADCAAGQRPLARQPTLQAPGPGSARRAPRAAGHGGAPSSSASAPSGAPGVVRPRREDPARRPAASFAPLLLLFSHAGGRHCSALVVTRGAAPHKHTGRDCRAGPGVSTARHGAARRCPRLAAICAASPPRCLPCGRYHRWPVCAGCAGCPGRARVGCPPRPGRRTMLIDEICPT